MDASEDHAGAVVPPPLQPPAALDPVPERERLDVLDLLRGIAILGILLVNVFAFGLPGSAFATATAWGLRSWADGLAFVFVHFFAFTKFFPIFSLLFGAGLILQVSRFEEKGLAASRYFRRLLFLGIVGLLHGVVFWYGDILLTYALFGVVVFFCRGFQPKVLAWVGSSLLAVYAAFTVMSLGALIVLAQFIPDPGEPATLDNMVELVEESRQKAAQVYPDAPEGPLQDLVAWGVTQGEPGAEALEAYAIRERNLASAFLIRVGQLSFAMCSCLCVFGLSVLGYMLIGAWLMKSGRFADLQSSTPMFRRWVLYGLPIGWTLCGVGTALRHAGGDFAAYETFLTMVGSIPAVLGYVGAVCLLARSPRVIALTAPIRACGRMAFTNYLLQTLIMTTLFYGHGFALFGEFGYAGLLGIVVLVWAVQVVFSVAWLAKFRLGPLEYLWRAWTYGHFTRLAR